MFLASIPKFSFYNLIVAHQFQKLLLVLKRCFVVQKGNLIRIVKNTAIFGSSLGGLISYYAVLKYPEVFGKAGVFSPSFWFSKDIFEMTQKTKKLKAKIYFMCGDNEDAEMVPDVNKMVYLVDSIRCHCLALNKTEIVKGGQHNEKLWRENFKKAYLWLF